MDSSDAQQSPFAIEAARIAGQAAIGPQHAVAGHHHAQRVAAHRRAHGPHGAGVAQLAAQRAVAGGLAPANLQQRAPHGLLECRAARQIQRQVEVLALAGQVLLQLVRGLLQHGVMAWTQRPGARAVQLGGGLVALAFKPDARQAGGGGGQPHGPQRGVGPCLHGEGVKLHVEKSLEGDKGRFGAKSGSSSEC